MILSHQSTDGSVEFISTIIRDITERKQAEEKIRISLQEKEILLKEIHHRVKNNMQVVSSILQLQSGYIHDPVALGMFQEARYMTSSAPLALNDLILLYTDGLFEVQGENEELYSQERLTLDVKNFLAHPPGILFDVLLEVIRGFAVNGEFDDDVCLVGMDYIGLPQART